MERIEAAQRTLQLVEDDGARDAIHGRPTDVADDGVGLEPDDAAALAQPPGQLGVAEEQVEAGVEQGRRIAATEDHEGVDRVRGRAGGAAPRPAARVSTLVGLPEAAVHVEADLGEAEERVGQSRESIEGQLREAVEALEQRHGGADLGPRAQDLDEPHHGIGLRFAVGVAEEHDRCVTA